MRLILKADQRTHVHKQIHDVQGKLEGGVKGDKVNNNKIKDPVFGSRSGQTSY